MTPDLYSPGGNLTADQVRKLYGVGGSGYGIGAVTTNGIDPGVTNRLSFDDAMARGAGSTMTLNRPGNYNQQLTQNADGTFTLGDVRQYNDGGILSGMSDHLKTLGNNEKFLGFAGLAGGLGAASGLGLLGSGAGTAGAAGTVGGAGSVASPASTLASAAGGGGAALSNASAGLGAASAGGLGGFLGNNAGAVVAGLGGLAGAMDQAPDSYTNTSSIDPAVKPQILDYMQTARERMDRDANPMQNAGYAAIQGAAGDQGLLNQAQTSLGQFMGGGARNPYSGSNPYLEGMIGRASNDVVDRFRQAVGGRDAQFANANAFGGSAYQQARQQDEKQLQQSLGDIQNQFRFQDYGQQAQLAENQLGRQMQATMFSPSMDAARYTAGNQLMQAGDNRAGWQQQGWQNYANAMNTGMGIGSQNTQANPYQTNRLSSALGGALGAYQIFKGFGS